MSRLLLRGEGLSVGMEIPLRLGQLSSENLIQNIVGQQ